jgi:Domain of unknown function (DUF4157)
MQRAAGNEVVNLAVDRGIQTKLVVGPADDPAERQADRVAEAVLRSLVGDDGAGGGSAPEEGARISRKTLGSTDPLGGTDVDADNEAAIAAARSGGSPLDPGVRARMEMAFGSDFGAVRIHRGGEADRLSCSLQARAFTTGPDIFFTSGAYQPGTLSGQALLAHELTHVVQQGASAARSATERGTPRRSREVNLVPTLDPTGRVSEVRSLRRSARSATVAEQLTPPAASRLSTSGRGGAVVVQRVPLTPTDERYIATLKKKKTQAKAKQRIEAFEGGQGKQWTYITTGLPEGEKTHTFLTDVYRRLAKGDTLERLAKLRETFDEEQLSTTGSTSPSTQPRSPTDKLLKQGAINVMNFGPGRVTPISTGGPGFVPGRSLQSVQRPTGGGESKPTPQLGSGLGGSKLTNVNPGRVTPISTGGPGLVPGRSLQSVPRPTGGGQKPPPQLDPDVFEKHLADLFSLNLDAMWEKWKSSLQPDFDDHLSAIVEPFVVKAAYLAYRDGKDWRDVTDELRSKDAPEQLLRDFDKVNLADLIERDEPAVTKIAENLEMSLKDFQKAFSQWKNTTLLYHAFAWSAAKHKGAGPGDVAPSEGEPVFEWLKRPTGSVTTRVYLTTTVDGTATVAKELYEGWRPRQGPPQPGLKPPSYGGLKYAGAGAAADRRDAIVIYVSDLESVLGTIARYQNDGDRLKYFLNERVRLSRPAIVDRGGELRGVGIVDHPEGEKSFSQLASGAVLEVLQRPKGSKEALLRQLASALFDAGLDPNDPSKVRI